MMVQAIESGVLYDEAVERALLAELMDQPDLAASLHPDDFYFEKHRTVFEAIQTLADKNSPVDLVTLNAELSLAGSLKVIGGAAWLAELSGEAISAQGARHHTSIIKNLAERRRLKRLGQWIVQAVEERVPNDEIYAKFQETGEKRQVESPSLGTALLRYEEMASLKIPERPRIFPWLPEGGICMAFGPRGVGKTFFNLTLASSLVTGTNFFRWEVSKKTGVLYVDGEMDLDELRGRLTSLLPQRPEAPLAFLTSHYVYTKIQRDLVLTDPDVRQEITSILDENPDLRVLILDNISCLFSGIDEDRKRDWEPIASWLIRLRHRGITILLVHHAGKGGQQRGTSGREDSLDTVIQLSKPAEYTQKDGCHFEITFSKCRSAKGDSLEDLDVLLAEVNGKLEWTWKPLSISKEEQALRLFEEGVTSPSDMAEEMGISKGYASKLLRKIKAQGRDRS